MASPNHQARMREESQSAIQPARIADWRAEIERANPAPIDRLPCDRPVDLVSEHIDPWCLAVAAIVTGAEMTDREWFIDLAKDISAAAADPTDADLVARGASAVTILGNRLQRTASPSASLTFERAASQARTFVALARTVACVLANGCLALLRNPAELKKLRSRPDLMPSAIEEILRYGCVPATLYRHATADANPECLQFHKGDRVILNLASANRDPEWFADADRFDVARRSAGNVSLGFGPHYCAGSGLLRMVLEVAIASFLKRDAELDPTAPIEWQGGSSFQSPASLVVRFAR
jgi:cytochrome P450